MHAAPARRDSASETADHAVPPPAVPAQRRHVPPAGQTWQLQMPARTRGIAQARSLLARWMGSRRDPAIPSDVADDAVLLFSELATNAVVHTGLQAGRDLLCGAVLSREGTLRIEVHDHAADEERPRVRRGDEGDESGRGLNIVEALAADWGVLSSQHTGGNAVWATLPVRTRPER